MKLSHVLSLSAQLLVVVRAIISVPAPINLNVSWALADLDSSRLGCSEQLHKCDHAATEH